MLLSRPREYLLHLKGEFRLVDDEGVNFAVRALNGLLP
jgi:hypothetical protein